jgi:hypothetical protein
MLPPDMAKAAKKPYKPRTAAMRTESHHQLPAAAKNGLRLRV